MKHIDIEKSIIKKFRKEIWRNFVKAINNYELIKDGDIIAVCISGGKDSFLLAKCLEEIKKHGKIKFDLKFITMNPGYNDKVKNSIINNARVLNLDLNIFESDTYKYISTIDNGSPCYLCARMRRGYLYNYAKDLGCNKIALGHHFDDVIETILLSMFYNGEIKTMMPKLHSTNFEGMELIRPLYLVKEDDIKAWQKYNNLEFIHCECPLSEKNIVSKRQEIKELIKKLKETNKFIDINVFKSVENINLNTIISYYKDDIKYNFLDDYEDDKNV